MSITKIRMQRQHLLSPATRDEYDELFRKCSPVQTEYWTSPGSPPLLAHRADFDDLDHNDLRRSQRKILKGRFMGGGVGYVDREDLELFVCAYRREAPFLTPVQAELVELIRREGPMNVQLMKEVTGMLVKVISPALHKLQESFVIFEDQVDSEWDRAFYLFEEEFPEVDFEKYERIEAVSLIIKRFLWLNVVASPDSIKSFYRFSSKDIKSALERLVNSQEVCTCSGGYCLQEDVCLLDSSEPVPKSVLVLHRSDILVRYYENMLKTRFIDDNFGVMYYILIDGEFRGAVFGRFTFGPYEVENVVVDLPENEKNQRKNEIFEAVYKLVDKERSLIKRFCGELI